MATPAQDQFREAAAEPLLATYRVAVQVRSGSVWAALFGGEAGELRPRQLWSKRYIAPAGKTADQCLMVVMMTLMKDLERLDHVLFRCPPTGTPEAGTPTTDV